MSDDTYVLVKAPMHKYKKNVQTMYEAEYKKNVQTMYEKFKDLLRFQVCDFLRDNHDNLYDGLVVMTIATGKKDSKDRKDKSKPSLDIEKGNNADWSLEQTINQHIKGVGGYNKLLSNIPGFTVAETLRYLHTNPETRDNAPSMIDETTPFKPVLPNRVIIKKGEKYASPREDVYVLVSKIIADDFKFLELLTQGLKKYNPGLTFMVESITGDDSEIVLEGNRLILSHEYINLVIRDDSDNFDGSFLPTQNDDVLEC